jgi:hypothetical protein
MKIVESKPKLIKNAIAYQNKTTPNSLTVHEWNHIINVLKTQTNLNTEYLDKLHYILFGSSTSDFIETPSLPEVKELIADLEDFKDGWNINIENQINQAIAVETQAREQAIEDLQDIYVKKTDATKVEASETNGNIKVDNEEVVVYDDTAVKQQITDDITTHNTSELAHPFLKGKIDEARAIAEGKVSAMSFATKAQLDAWLEIPENRETLMVGTNFYIEDLASPDYWWNGTTLVELSTDKIDLTEYAKKTETYSKTEIDAMFDNLLGGEY